MRITESQLRRIVRAELREMMGHGDLEGPGGGLTWDDFAGFGMDQVAEAFMQSGGDPQRALDILNAGQEGSPDDDMAFMTPGDQF